jgi:DNA invertase Pin-like site-specific DNA recombinase
MLLGYARVSTTDQESALQLDALRAAGCERIFEEKASGAKEDRPELARLFDHARKGDVLVVWKLDRLARSLKQLVLALENLGKRGIGFRCLAPVIDTTTPEGRLLYSITGAFAEFEREIISQRTRAGLKAAFARGRKGGRPKALDANDIAKARAMLRDPTISVAAIAKLLGVSRVTIYSYLPEARTRARVQQPN